MYRQVVVADKEEVPLGEVVLGEILLGFSFCGMLVWNTQFGGHPMGTLLMVRFSFMRMLLVLSNYPCKSAIFHGPRETDLL